MMLIPFFEIHVKHYIARSPVQAPQMGVGCNQARRTFASFFRFYCIFSNVLYSLQQIVANIESRRNK